MPSCREGNEPVLTISKKVVIEHHCYCSGIWRFCSLSRVNKHQDPKETLSYRRKRDNKDPKHRSRSKKTFFFRISCVLFHSFFVRASLFRCKNKRRSCSIIIKSS